MSKRFIDNEIWKHTSFRNRCIKCKLFWIYLFTTCDIAGVWEVDFKLATFLIGEELNEVFIRESMKDEIIEIDDGKRWFIPKYLIFQYPQGLNSNKPIVLSVKKQILTRGLVDTVQSLYGNDYLIIDESLKNDCQIVKVKVMVKAKVKDTVKVTETSTDMVKEIHLNIISHLNAKTGAHYRTDNKATIKLIDALIKAKHTEDDFLTVIDNMTAVWKNDPKMERYLRPETLFSAKKFEGYLNMNVIAATAHPKTKEDHIREQNAEVMKRALARGDGKPCLTE